MIVWLASYPRSGNTYFRILLNHLYGIKTPMAYVGNTVRYLISEILYKQSKFSTATIRVLCYLCLAISLLLNTDNKEHG